MMYYDLSLEVDDIDGNSRRELVSTALQLGYTSVSSNHIHSGTMADSDRSKLKPLDVSSILSAAPGIAESVKFHQKVLGVPAKQPFRQYTRITVVLEDAVQAAALNSANPVLRTYDIVAVRPTNQKAFEIACKNSEVDLISLDLFKRLPFRMKAPMVKGAMQRGAFFEICYARALFDGRARKALFANAQVFQAVTRGHGIVVSSGACRSMELRGPNDVTNMATLFGLSVDIAKAAVSKNCESVILHGVARKKAFKAAIIIERVPPLQSDSLFEVPSVWDPLSVGTAKGSSVSLSPLLEAAGRKDPPSESISGSNCMKPKEFDSSKKVGVVNKVGSTVFSTSDGKDDKFVSMVMSTNEWTEVGKRGKLAKGKRPNGPTGADRDLLSNKNCKKRKFY